MTLTQALERIAFLEDQVKTLNEIIDKKASKKSLSRGAYLKRLRDERRGYGLCTVCGNKLPEGSTVVRCENCRNRANKYAAGYREKAREERRAEKLFHSDDMYNYEEASICLTCEAERCTGNCKRFREKRNKLGVSNNEH